MRSLFISLQKSWQSRLYKQLYQILIFITICGFFVINKRIDQYPNTFLTIKTNNQQYIISRNTISNATNNYNLSNILPLTCLSFPNHCSYLQTNTALKQTQLNLSESLLNTWTIIQLQLQTNHSNDSILYQFFTDTRFLLSFRREYMLWHNKTNTNTTNTYYINLLSIINRIYLQSKQQRSILYHTHISKCLGTTEYQTIFKIAKVAHKRWYIGNHPPNGHHLWKQLPPIGGIKSYPSCDWLYTWATVRKYNEYVHLTRENPLEIHKLCPQFVHSIILREPIQHRLSFLRFKLLKPHIGGILCKYNQSQLTPTELQHIHSKNQCFWKPTTDENIQFIQKQKYVNSRQYYNNDKLIFDNDTIYIQCLESKHMKGFIHYIFNETNENYIKNKKSKRLSVGLTCPCVDDKYLDKECGASSFIEWINDINADHKFVLFNQNQLPSPKKERPWFNVSFWRTFLGNTYVRWLGYNLSDVNTDIFESVTAHPDDINGFHLMEAKRVLLQYDYVLPVNYQYKLDENILWKKYLIEMHRMVLQKKEIDVDKDMIITEWPAANKNKQYPSVGLMNEEMELLRRQNVLDIKLFEFALDIAHVDTLSETFD